LGFFFFDICGASLVALVFTIKFSLYLHAAMAPVRLDLFIVVILVHYITPLKQNNFEFPSNPAAKDTGRKILATSSMLQPDRKQESTLVGYSDHIESCLSSSIKWNGSHCLSRGRDVQSDVLVELCGLSCDISGGILSLCSLDLQTKDLSSELQNLVGNLGVLFSSY
jgi:hypothetical protein